MAPVYDWWNRLPNATKTIITELQNEGFEAFLVGGAVRDLLINRKPKDFDIATNATPEQVKFLFSKTIEVGIKFGIVVVLIGNEQVEVATFRSDGSYADNRHPDKVEFSTPELDAKRRDFTINGLFWDSKSKQIIDYVEGILDVNRKIIQTIGRPEERFKEDGLRILRAIRFATQLNNYGFEIERKTAIAIQEKSELLKNISKERITDEVEKILLSKKPSIGLRKIRDLELTKYIFLELSKTDVVIFDEMLKVFDRLSDSKNIFKIDHELNKSLYWGTLLAYDESKNLLNGFVLPKSTQKSAIEIANTDINNAETLSVANLKRLLAKKEILEILALHHAKCHVLGNGLEVNDFCIQKLKEFTEKQTLSPSPLINGNDLIAIGFKPGKIFQDILNEIYDMQLENRITSAEEAKAIARNIYNGRQQ